MNVLRALCALMLIALSVQAQAVVKVQVDKTALEQGESLRLTLDMVGHEISELDLQPLAQDFEILSRNNHSRTTIINGKVQGFSKVFLSIRPKIAGDIEIPALTVGADKSTPIKLKVKPVHIPSAAEGGLEMLSSISDQAPWVQQPLIYEVSILIAMRVYDSAFVEPTIKQGKALIQPLGQMRQYREQRYGRDMVVVKKSWVVTPQSSGVLEIASAQLNVSIPKSVTATSTRDLRRVTVKSENTLLDVRSIPKTYTGKNWITAQSLTLDDELNVDGWRVGEPISRKIIMTAQGTMEEQITALDFPESQGLKQYAAKPVFEHDSSGAKLGFTMTQEITLIPTTAGELTLPEVRVVWWNTQTNQEQVSFLKARTIKVAPGETTQGIQQADSEIAPQQMAPKTNTNVQGEAQTPESLSLWQSRILPALIIALLIGILLGSLISGVISKRRKAGPRKIAPEAQVEKFSLPAFKKVCQENDARAAREAFGLWAQQQFPECKHLNEVITKVSTELGEEIKQLNRCCFAKEESLWQGAELYRLVAAYKTPKQRSENEPLASLVPKH